MIAKLVAFLLLLAFLLAAWRTGCLESIRSGAVPESGRECIVAGPIPNKGVPVAVDPESLKKEMDTHVGGASSARLAGVSGLQSLYDDGQLATIADRSKVKIIENGQLRIDGVPYQIVKVRLLDGDNKGSTVWIERINLIDTPIQAVFQSLRTSGKSAPETAKPKPSGAE